LRGFSKINKYLGAERILLLLTVFSILSSFYVILFGKTNIFKYIEKEEIKKSLLSEIKQIEKENTLLRKEISFLKRDRFYIEKKAREDLGLVKEGDEIYIIVQKKRKTQEKEDRWIDKVIKKYQEFILRQ
jgi:cell division protein FtsB